MNRKSICRWMLLGVAVAGCLAGAYVASAKNVDLVTLPGRDKVQLTIYNSEDLTLVKETRALTFKKGLNQIQFSWAGTLIDPTSVEFRTLDHVKDLEVADTVFPGQKPQHLIWNIESKFDGQASVEITYFTSGLTWSMDYTATADAKETALRFDGHVRVYNRSGEEYENAEVRLIVGTINLVEKIADLARRYGVQPPQPGEADYDRLRRDAVKESVAKAEVAAAPAPLRPGGPATEAKQIVKEGLSEYFMFSVAGTEAIRNGWSKRMQAVKAEAVKFDIVYRMRTHQYGPRPVRFFLWRNDSEHKLGECPLPDGLVRIFRDNGQDGLSYLGEQTVRYVPIKAEIEINLGPDDLVVYESVKTTTKRLNFSFDQRNNVNGWDERQQWVDTIRNYRDKPIALEMRRIWDGDVEYDSEMKTALYDFHTAEAKFTVGARGRVQYPFELLIHNGANASQSRIKLKERSKD